MTYNDFNYAYILADLLFGIEIDPVNFEEVGLIAWNMIGNKRTRLYHTVLDVDCNDGSVQLPCNADMIEAVTRLGEDYQKTGNSIAFDNYNSSFTEGYIESRKTDKGPLYISGGLVKYTQTEDKIFVNPSIGKVRILYHGIELDDDGLPRITDKEAIAIAHYVAYIFSYKKSLLTNNPNTMLFSLLLKADWEKKADSARVDKLHWSLNDMNDILDVKSSWNRKVPYKSYKPVR